MFFSWLKSRKSLGRSWRQAYYGRAFIAAHSSSDII